MIFYLVQGLPSSELGSDRNLVNPPRCANSWSAAILLAVFGWVENKLSMPRPDNGLMINIWAVAGLFSAVSFPI